MPNARRSVLFPLFGVLAACTAQLQAGLIGVTNTNTLYDLSTTTGAASNGRLVTGLQAGEEVSGLTYGGGVLYGYTSARRLYTIDPTTGAATFVATGSLASSDIAVQAGSGQVFGLTGGQVATMFSINPATGTTTTIGSHNSPFNEPPSFGGGLVNENRAGLAFNGAGQLWGTTRTVSLNVDSVTELRRYDPLTGAIVTRIDYSSFFDADRGDIVFDPITGTLYFADGPARASGSLWIMSTLSEVTTEVGFMGLPSNAGINGLAIIPDVPEPGTVMLLGSGLALILAGRARKRGA